MIGTHTFPTLYAKSSTGKIKQYDVRVDFDPDNSEDGADIHVLHGYVGGKKQDDVTTIREGKNIGKVNETTPYQQALKEAEAVWKKAKDRKYVGSLEELETTTKILPMLAHKYSERKHKIVWPCYVQPKLNGVRCIAERKGDEIILHSRGGKTYNAEFFPAIVEILKKVMEDGDLFDGELYNHFLNFQEICAAVKKRRSDSDLIQYWIYDIPHKTKTFEQRFVSVLHDTDEKDGLMSDIEHASDKRDTIPYVLCVDTIECFSEDWFKKFHGDFTNEENHFEGTILRNAHGLYAFDHRSVDLQKYKDFLDAEFKIVDIVAADTGREEGAAICRCEITSGATFDVRLKGSMEYRREIFKDKVSVVGKNLTVRYQNLSVDGIPIFPVGVGIRDYE